jgi:hypothetical protein
MGTLKDVLERNLEVFISYREIQQANPELLIYQLKDQVADKLGITAGVVDYILSYHSFEDTYNHLIKLEQLQSSNTVKKIRHELRKEQGKVKANWDISAGMQTYLSWVNFYTCRNCGKPLFPTLRKEKCCRCFDIYTGDLYKSKHPRIRIIMMIIL